MRRVAKARGRAPTRPQQARSERTRGEVLEAALALLAAGGPAAVTHRAVADEAGLSLGAVTYHFPAKVDLLGEVYQLHLARVRARAETIRDRFAEDGGDAPEAARRRLVAGVTRYLEQGVREDRVGSLATFELALERARDPVLRRRLRAAEAESGAYAAEMLGAFGSQEPETDAELLISALNGLRLAWLAEGERSGFAKRVPALVERLSKLLLLARES